jgi:hypothetical protein
MVSGIARRREAEAAAPAACVIVYYLLWRKRPAQPWHSEEFDSRSQAHQRYFTLVERGVEAYLERRRARLPA